MHVLIATGLYPPETGGPATYTKELEELLPKRGHTVSVLPFRAVRSLPPGVRHIAYFWKCFVRGRTADIVFAQDTVSVGFPSALAACLAGKRFFVRVPGDYAWEQGRQRFGVSGSLDEFKPERWGFRVRLLSALQRFVLRLSERVIVPSAYLKRIVISWRIPERKVSLIYNGVAFPVPTAAPATRPEGFCIVSIGRLVPWKGMGGLVRAVARESSWRAIIVGEGPEKRELQELARREKCEERVRFTGPLARPQALGWAAAADAFVLNSSYEGLSHQLIEAMSLGTPIIATEAGGNPELLRNGTDGFLIAPGDTDALHEALKWVEKNPEKARRMGRSAAVRAREFSADAMADRLTELFSRT